MVKTIFFCDFDDKITKIENFLKNLQKSAKNRLTFENEIPIYSEGVIFILSELKIFYTSIPCVL